MVLETSGESFGVPTPAGSVLPSSDRRSEMPWRATCTSMPSAKVIVTTDESGNGLGAHGREPRRAVDGIFDLLGDQLLDLLRGEARGFGLDVDLRRHELRKHIQRRAAARPSSRAPAPTG